MKQEMVKPYGDTLNDGIVQMSFTLPVENGARAKKAAEVYVSRLNFKDINVAHARKIADNFTFFVVYARAKPAVNYASVKADEVKFSEMGFYEINDLIKRKLGRRITVVGATIGSDAHTVGIDAIMNMKGYNQDYGLERYPQINTVNMGAQVTCEALIRKAGTSKRTAHTTRMHPMTPAVRPWRACPTCWACVSAPGEGQTLSSSEISGTRTAMMRATTAGRFTLPSAR